MTAIRIDGNVLAAKVRDRIAADVTALKARGITHIVECGPGKVLAGMTKRIDAELTGAALYDPATLNEVKELLA